MINNPFDPMEFILNRKIIDEESKMEAFGKNMRGMTISIESSPISPLTPLPLSSRSISSTRKNILEEIENNSVESVNDSVSVSTSFLPLKVENTKDIENTQDRELICDDALVWLETFADSSLPGCVFTSLPDISEINHIFTSMPGELKSKGDMRQFRIACDMIWHAWALSNTMFCNVEHWSTLGSTASSEI